MYKVYSHCLQKSETEFQAKKEKLTFRSYDSLDDALRWARDADKVAGITWLIEGDDGTRLTRLQIKHQLEKRAAQLAGQPKRYG